MNLRTWTYASVFCLLAACGGGQAPEPFTPLLGSTANAAPRDEGPGDAGAPQAEAEAEASAEARFTPVTMRIAHPPVPVEGSDGRFHVVYEIELANFTGDDVALHQLDVLDARSGSVVATLDASQLGQRLVVRDKVARPGSLGPSQMGLAYMHVVFDSRAAMPQALAHRLSLTLGSKSITETAGRVRLAAPTDLVLDSPLRGPRYIAGDGCCDAVRHVRASLPLNGRLFTAQRFAIDWEQLDEQGRIYVGDPRNPASYLIYGQPAYAAAEARVVAAVDGLPDTPPGALPEGLPLEQADGNHVVLDLGDGRFALYAHFKPGSVQVRKGERVRRGQVLGLVGTSGNSSEPHLHFHVMDGPSPLASNGLPYRLRHFRATRRGVSTAAFDQAIIDGRPIPTELVPGPAWRERVLPLDLWIVDFPEQG